MNYGRDNSGNLICTGAQMGRRNIVPEKPDQKIKLSIQRLKFTDGCYDKGGAYWGLPENLYCAFAYKPSCVSIMLNFNALVFIRANSRAEAKQLVRKQISGATFYH